MLYDEILKYDSSYYLSGWELYLQLIKNKDEIKSKSYYKWDNIYDDEILEYLKFFVELDLKDQYNTIIEIVENYIIKDINNTNGYKYINNNIEIEWWVLENLEKCDNCGNIWDGYAQCNCYLYQ